MTLRRLGTQILNNNQFSNGGELAECIKCGNQTTGRASVGSPTAICATCYTREQADLGKTGSTSNCADCANGYCTTHQRL